VDCAETPFGRSKVEADEAVFVDDDPRRTMWGTGTEDYLNDAWGIHPCVTPLSGGDSGSSFRKGIEDEILYGYRFHFSDCIPFEKKIAFTLEHGSSNNCSGIYRSVAYYYMKPSGKNIDVVGFTPRRMDRYYSI